MKRSNKNKSLYYLIGHWNRNLWCESLTRAQTYVLAGTLSLRRTFARTIAAHALMVRRKYSRSRYIHPLYIFIIYCLPRIGFEYVPYTHTKEERLIIPPMTIKTGCKIFILCAIHHIRPLIYIYWYIFYIATSTDPHTFCVRIHM